MTPPRLRAGRRFLALLLMLTLGVRAETITWSNPAGGDYHDSGNWTPAQVPGTNDVAVFDLVGPYTVTWSGNATSHSFRVTQGTVTWNLNGNTFGVDKYSTNSVGTVGTTADLTITNGTVIRMNAVYLNSFNYSFKLKGPGTTMRLLTGGRYLNAYYAEYGAGTTLLVNGTGAQYSNGGMYSRECKGTIIVTNDATLAAHGGWTIQTGADIRISGPGYRGTFAPSSLAAGASFRIDNGASLMMYGGNPNPSLIDGTLTLDDGRLYYLNTVGGIRFRSPSGLLDGSGQLEYQTIDLAGGTIRPGGGGRIGTLACLGNLTNSTGTGAIEIELGGTGAGEIDRMTFAPGAGGAGHAHFGGMLKVILADEFTPADDDAFDLFDYVSCGGAFASIEYPGGEYWAWNTNELYTTGTIRYELPETLDAPANVAASDGAYLDRIEIDWDTVDPATGYQVWRSLTNDSATAAQIGVSSGSPYADYTPEVDTTYYYWLKATNAYLVSDFSLSAAGLRQADLPVPAVPQDVAASDGVYMYQGRVVVSWSAAADAAGYEVWRNASNDLSTAFLLGLTAATGFADTATTVGVTNFYWVRATNELYVSGFSLSDSGWMAPEPPFEILWTNPGGGNFDDPANWTPPYVPGLTNRAVFTIAAAPYTVNWSRSLTNASFRLHEGTVTWNLNGFTHTVNALESISNVGGSDSTTARLTVTNGTLHSLGTGGPVSGRRLRVRGLGSELRVLNAKATGLPYPYIYAPARVIVDGPAAELRTAGYTDVYGALIATNGAYLKAPDGTRMYVNSDLQIHGGSLMHEVALSVFQAGVTVRFTGDISVRNYYVNAARRIYVSGRLMLGGAYLYDTYTWPGSVTSVSIEDSQASLEGRGTLGYSYLDNNGLVAPGGTNGIGLITVRGAVTNRPNGVIDIQLAGGEPNRHDRLHAVYDATRGPQAGGFFAGGKLRVSLADGFKPQKQGFKIFDFLSFSGSFDSIELPDLPGVWDTSLLAVDGTLAYQPPPAGAMLLLR